MTYKEYSQECQKCKHKKMCNDCENRAEREQIIINVINEFIAKNNRSPYVSEIAKEIGLHKSSTHLMLTRMAEKGYITYGKGKLGIIRVL